MIKTKTFLALVFLLSAFVLFSQEKSVQDSFFEDLIIIKVKPEYRDVFKTDKGFLNLMSKSNMMNIRRKFPTTKPPDKKFNDRGEMLVDLSLIYELEFGQYVDVFGIISVLNKYDFIDYAEPLYHVDLLYIPDDPLNQTNQYWLDNIQAYDAWSIHKGDTNIVIGIVDTGIDIIHEDLMYNIKYNYNDLPNGNDDDLDGYVDNFRGWDFGDNNNNPQAEYSFHGSWVSGIASASTDNGIGMSGVGFKCRFLPIKVMNKDGIIARAYEGVVYAADQGSHVINCSWGNTTFQKMAQDVINYVTYNRDALVIGACGNTNSDILFYPASYENVISVAATTVNDEKWTPENTGTTSGSSYSRMVDISAPGTMMRTTNNQNYMLTYGGTSFAAPVVSGAAGILRSYYPHFSALQIGKLLKIGADCIDTVPANLPFQGRLGDGRLNMYNSLTMEHTPAVAFKNPELSENRSVNDTVVVYGNFVNYLAPTENLSVKISSESHHIQVFTAQLEIGSLNTLEIFDPEEQIKLFVRPGTPNDFATFIKLHYEDENYENIQYIPITVNYSFLDISTNILNLSIVPNGRLGFSNLSNTIGNGMRLKGARRLYYDQGIISGLSADKVYCAVRQSTDFRTLESPYRVEENTIADNKVVTIFNDDFDPKSLKLEIIQTAYSWDDAERENFIILNFELINKGTTDIIDYYFGVFTDWDLIQPSNNSAYYCSKNQIMYCQHNGNETLYAGMKLLTGQKPNDYAFPQKPGGDGLIDVTDGFSDQEKFYLISNSNNGYGSINIENDIIVVSSAGPFDIPQDDTVNVAFAVIVAESYFTLINSIEKAEDSYRALTGMNYVKLYEKFRFDLFPNPADEKLYIILPEKTNTLNTEIEILNSDGKTVISHPVKSLETIINTRNLKPGIYTVIIRSGNIHGSRNVIISR